MTIRQSLCLALCLPIVSTVIAGSVCQSSGYRTGDSFFGSATCGQGTLASLSVFGKARMNQTEVDGSTNIHGRLTATKVKLHALEVFGRTTLVTSKVTTNTKIHGALTTNHSSFSGPVDVYGRLLATQSEFADVVTIYGALAANHSHFMKKISIHSTSVQLTDSTTDNVVVDTNPLQHGVVNLVGQSSVHNITFTGRRSGIVNLGPNAKITGKVTNGKINKQ